MIQPHWTGGGYFCFHGVTGRSEADLLSKCVTCREEHLSRLSALAVAKAEKAVDDAWERFK